MGDKQLLNGKVKGPLTPKDTFVLPIEDVDKVMINIDE